jgi:hypothetical protein
MSDDVEYSNDTQIFSHLFDDLEIKNKIYPSVCKTITSYGKAEIKKRLNYISTTNLENWTTTIKFLKNQRINEFDENLITLLKLEDVVNKWLIFPCDNDLHFKGCGENVNNVCALNISNKIKFSNILITIVFYIFMYYFLNYIGSPIEPVEYFKSLATGYYKLASFILSFIVSNETALEYMSTALTFLYIGYMFYQMYQTCNICYTHYGKCEDFKKEYYDILLVIQSCKNIWNADIFRNKLYSKEYILKIKKSFEYLEKEFNPNNSLGSMIILNLNKLDYSQHLKNILGYAGKIDMLLSNVNLLDKGFTIPLVDNTNDTPYIVVDNMWNVILNYDDQVKNNSIIGLNKHKTMIITGPNKAGKSTFIRSLVLSIYLAQSLGITCASSLTFTPFTQIFTYLNVPDTVGKESLFEAELERCYAYYSSLKNATPNERIIGFIDELFTGTNYYEGMAGSYGVIKKISEMKNSLTVLSTHFHEICTIKNIQYMKFEALENDDKNNKKYTFPYKIKQGISDQLIALELLKERGYDDDIITLAYDKLNEIKKVEK